MPSFYTALATQRKLILGFKADSTAVDTLKKKVEEYQDSIARVPSFTDLIVLVGIALDLLQ